MRQSQRKEQPNPARTPTFECSPWTPRELVVEEVRTFQGGWSVTCRAEL